MQPVPQPLVIRRSAEQERRIQRTSLIVVVTQGFNSFLCLVLALVWFLSPTAAVFLPREFAIVPLVAAACGVYVVWTQIRWRRINRELRNLQLALTPHGVVYRSAAGTYSAPWSSVRQVRIRGRPGGRGGLAPILVVDVLNWGGPVARLGRGGRLVMSLTDCEVDSLQIRQAVHLLSSGKVIALRG